VETIHRADFDAIGQFALDAALGNDKRHIAVLTICWSRKIIPTPVAWQVMQDISLFDLPNLCGYRHLLAHLLRGDA
jgi:hypothetical protein